MSSGDAVDRAAEALDRRGVLKSLAGIGTAALAGCPGTTDRNTSDAANSEDGGSNGAGSADTDSDDDSSAGSETTNRLAIEMGANPQQLNFNPFGKQAAGVEGKLMYEQAARWHDGDQEWIPLLVGDWSYPENIESGSVVTIELNDYYTWSNGDQYTSEDFVGQMQWREATNDPVWNFITDAAAAGDHTVELTLTSEIDTRLFENALFGMGDNPVNWNFKYDVFEEYLADIQDASSDEDRSAVIEEVSNLTISLEEAQEMGLANGPFVPSRTTANELILEKNEEYQNPHVSADEIPVDELRALPIDSPQNKLRSLRNNEVDALHNVAFSEAQAGQVPDNYEGLTYYTHSGEAVFFNCRREPLDNRHVRYAISHVLKAQHETIMNNLPLSDLNKERIDLSVGMSNQLIDEWLDDRRDDFLAFDGGDERATELLEGEGFYREDGVWYTPDDEQFTLTYRGAEFHSNRTETAARILSNFGIETDAIVVEAATYFGETVPNRDYDLTNWWVGQSAPLPFEGLQNNLVNEAWVSAYPLGIPSVSEWQGEGTSEFVVEVPPIGEPEGELREVDVNEHLDGIAQSPDPADQKPHIEQLAWVWNWSNAMWGPYTLYLASEYYNTDAWDWPEKESEIMQAPSVQDWPIRHGYPEPSQ